MNNYIEYNNPLEQIVEKAQEGGNGKIHRWGLN